MLTDTPQEITGLHLESGQLRVEYAGRLSPWMSWRDVPTLRASLGQILLDLVWAHQHSWFAEECGRCGNSCRREGILVREGEIFALQRHLGLTQSEFHQRYLTDAPTWNGRDGFVKLTDEGCCPFLEGPAGGEPDRSSCSVYDLRPRACREFLSNQPTCRKDAGRLLEEFESCCLTPVAALLVKEDGSTVSCLTPPEVWQVACQAVVDCEAPEDERLKDLLDSLRTLLEHEILSFGGAREAQDWPALANRLRLILEEAGSLVALGEQPHEELEVLWGLFHRLQALWSQSSPSQECDSTVAQDVAWTSLIVREDGLWVRRGSGEVEALSASPTLAVGLLRTVLETPDDLLQQMLTPPDPPCFLCGECCRTYAVEILPSDIARLSRHLGLAPAEFVERYTGPSRFDWNLKSRILKKQAAPSYSKKLLELTLLDTGEVDQCVFLERRDDGLFYCTVHEHKPRVCRGYTASNKLCRETNQRVNAGRQAESLAWLEVQRDSLLVQTRRRWQEGLAPLTLAREDWPELDQAAAQLERELVGA